MKNFELDTKPILIVDDAPEIRAVIREALEANFHQQILEANNGQEAIHLLNKIECSLIVSDFSMPDGDGLSLFLHLKKFLNVSTAFILFTGSPEALALREQMVVIEKPNIEELIAAVKSLRIFSAPHTKGSSK